ncbi:MAG: hypothetical protein AB1298_09065, partial [Bacteroidota bacterium]
MNLSRNILLWASENKWLRSRVPSWKFVQSAVKKFMPGVKVEDALDAAQKLKSESISAVLTHLGENVKDFSEGLAVCNHYLELIDKIAGRQLDVEISLKLTHLGLDLSFDETYARFKTITQ